jgi:hypothetical protein
MPPLVRVTEDGLRLRQAPGLCGQILAELGRGTVLEAVDDQTTEADGHSWRHVRAPGGATGFVSAEFLAPHQPSPWGLSSQPEAQGSAPSEPGFGAHGTGPSPLTSGCDIVQSDRS